MNLLLMNVLLALIWAAMTGSVTPANLAAGFVLAYVALLMLQRPGAARAAYFQKTWKAAAFLAWFAREMAVSNLRVAHDVLTARHMSRPGVVAVPLDCATPLEITLFANLITLTPGTLTLDISGDRRTLYVHAMFIDDPEELRSALKDGERRLLELMR